MEEFFDGLFEITDGLDTETAAALLSDINKRLNSDGVTYFVKGLQDGSINEEILG